MSILLGVVLLFAVLSAAMAVVQATAISRLAPAVEWRGWLLGWWRFDEIGRRAGKGGAQNLAIYRRAVVATLIFVVFGLILSGWALNQRPAAMAEALPVTSIGERLDTAGRSDIFLLRPVASMPGAISLES